MTSELFFLILTAILTGCLWIPVVMGYVSTRGLLRPQDYKVAPESALPSWVERANRAHLNAVENIGPFAAVVLVAHLVGISTEVTQVCAATYFFARLAHAVVHVAGVSVAMARTVIFGVGWSAFIVFAIEVLRMASPS